MTSGPSPYRDTKVPKCRRRTHRLERMRALIELWSEDLPPFWLVLGSVAVCLAPHAAGSLAVATTTVVVAFFATVALGAFVASGGAPR